MLLRRKLPQTQEAMDKECDRFLKANGFPLTHDFRVLFASMAQGSEEGKDSYNPRKLAMCMRRAIANELLFYLIKPERRPQPKDVTDGPKEVSEASSKVE